MGVNLREEHRLYRLRMFENRVLRRIFGLKRNEVTGEWRNYIMRSIVIFPLCQVQGDSYRTSPIK
jgi:hypothetical protein